MKARVLALACIGIIALAGSADLGIAKKKRKPAITGQYGGRHVQARRVYTPTIRFNLSPGGAISGFVAIGVHFNCVVYIPHWESGEPWLAGDSPGKTMDVVVPTVSIGAIGRKRLPIGRTFLYDNGVPHYSGDPSSVEDTAQGTFIRLAGRTVRLGQVPFGLLDNSEPGFQGTLDVVTVEGPPRTLGTRVCTAGWRQDWQAAKKPNL